MAENTNGHKEVEMTAVEEGPTYAERAAAASVISDPMATYKTYKRVKKCIAKAFKHRKAIRGIKAVNKVLRKGNFSGFCVLAGNAEPLDTISHIPVACENGSIPYCFVPTIMDLRGIAVMIPEDETYEKAFKSAYESVKTLPARIAAA